MDHKTDIIVTKEESMMQMQENEIVLYQPNEAVHLEVRMANESVWLTQSQIALLFGVGQPAISKHLNNNRGGFARPTISNIHLSF